MSQTWTLAELVAEAATRLAALPPPANGQVRAVPDERTIRYYAAIGLLDRPAAMKGRTALYGPRHLAQVVAIKRMQGAGKSLAAIRELWPALDDATLGRMTGIAVAVAPRKARAAFWKRDAEVEAKVDRASDVESGAASAAAPELRIPLATGATLIVALPDELALSISPADLRALRAAAAPLVSELAHRGLIARAPGTLEEP